MAVKKKGKGKLANPEHLKILKKGAEAWNKWRRENPAVIPDLRKADLSHANLGLAILTRANLTGADLKGVNLMGADLTEADITGVELFWSNLGVATLKGVNFSEAKLFETILVNVDLSNAKNLASCIHRGPSYIDHNALTRSANIPEIFLRGCGLPDSLIEYYPSLLNQPIQRYSCFISYSSQDDEFAKRLHADLQDNNVRCWFAPDDLRIGDKIRFGIDEAIRIHDKLLLILSENSIDSQWVEQEVETALEKERNEDRLVLFPIRIDDSVFETKAGWAPFVKNSRHIGDFSNWKEHDSYKESFERILRDLKGES